MRVRPDTCLIRLRIGIKTCQVFSLLVLAALPLMAETIYVAPPPVGDDANNGLSWDAPKLLNQNAILAAGNGGEVVVSNGTYTLEATIPVNRTVLLRGVTGNPDDVVIDGNNAVRCLNLSVTATIEDLTIARGRTSGSDHGGGVFAGAASVFRNCRFLNNQAGGVGGAARFNAAASLTDCQIVGNSCIHSAGGGAFYASYGVSYTFTNCFFATNSASAGPGGAMVVLGSGTFTAASCVFEENTSAKNGGALDLAAESSRIENCVFTANSAKGGSGGAMSIMGGEVVDSDFVGNTCGAVGGAIRIYPTTPGTTLTRCNLLNNKTQGDSTDGGGGLYMAAGVVRDCLIAGNTTPSPGGGVLMVGAGLLENCVVSNNVSSCGSYAGAGIMLAGTDTGAVIQNCTIVGNAATNSGAQGGGFFLNAAATIRNCLVVGNQADYAGGGGRVRIAGGIVENCTIVNNHLANTLGGGLYIDNVASAFRNTIVWDNSVSSGSNSNLYLSGTAPAWSHCLTGPAVAGTDNLCDDPLFVDAGVGSGTSLEGGDFRLTKSSPCRDAGMLLDWMDAASLDFDGLPRVAGARPDIGAYEYWPPPPLSTVIVVR